MDRSRRLGYVVITVEGRHLIVSEEDGRVLPLVQGAADGEEAEFTIPDDADLSALDEESARALHEKLQARYDALRPEAKSKGDIEALRQIRSTQAKVAERITAIYAEAEEVARGLEEVDAPAELPQAPAAAEQQPQPTAQEVAPTAQAAAPGAATAGLSAEGVTGQRAPQAPAEQRPSSAPARPRVGYVAAAGQTIAQVNQPVDFEQIGRMADSVKSLDGSKGEIRAYVASLPSFEEMSDLGVPALSRDAGVTQTDRMIREAVEDWKFRTGRIAALPQGRTAAICDPLDIIREIPDCSTDADPFGDSLPQRPAGRLGFQFTPAISLSAVSSGVTAGWDDTAQGLVSSTDQTTWKPCVDIECPTPTPIRAEAVTACVRFDVTTEISNPERVQDILAKLAALRVRRRTQRLLTLADALSSAYTFTSTFGNGAFPGLVEASMSVVARAIYDERLDPGDYQLYLPPGLVETLATDLAGRAFNTDDPAGEAEAQADVVNEVQNITGLRTIRMWDVKSATSPFAALNTPGAGAVALPALGGGAHHFTLRFIAPEAALYFSTGEEKTGIESSPELMRQNKRQFFSEEFVGLAKHGCHPWFTVDAILCPNGSRTGFNTPVACS